MKTFLINKASTGYPRFSKWVRLVCLIIFLVTSLFYGKDVKAQEPFYQKLSINDGLPSNCVYEIRQDKEGFIWFATDKGVARFDGGNFEIFNEENGLVDNDVFLVRPDSRGRVWILSSNGEACFWKDGKIFNKHNTGFLKNLFSVTWFNSWGEDRKGNIWFGTYNNNFFRLDINDRLENYNSVKREKYKESLGGSNHSDIIIDSLGDAWIVGIYGAINLTKNPLHIEVPLIARFGKTIRSVLIDGDRIFSIVGDEAIITSRSGEEKLKDFKSGNGCISLVKGADGNIWFSDLKSLRKFNGGIISLKSIETVFSDKSISNTFIDSEKNIWLGTLGEGVCVIQHPDIKHYTSIFPVKREIQCVLKDSSGVWLGGDGGDLALMDGEKMKFFPAVRKFNTQGRGRIKAIRNVGMGQIALTYESQLIILNSSGKMAWLPLGTKSFFNLNNEYLIGTSNSFYRMPKSAFTKISGMSPQYNNKNPFFNINTEINKWRIHSGYRFNEVEIDSNNTIWLGTNKGLYTLDIERNSVSPAFSKFFQLRKPIVSILALNHETVIIAPANHGIFINWKNTLYSLKKNNVLSKCSVKKIVRISASSFWLCTDGGLFFVEISGVKLNIRHFGRRDGIFSEEINDVTKSSANWLIASDKGLTVFPEDQINASHEMAPKIIARFLKINDQDWRSQNTFIENKTDIRFRYGCLSFKNLGSYQFRYRLFKTDNWKTSDKLEQRISNLARGSYQIEVQGKSAGSPWSDSVFYPAFEVLPVFWQRGWFLFVSIVTLMAISAYVLLAWYKHKLRKENLDLQLIDANLKALRAQIKPHFIFNSMNAVQNYFLKNETEKGLEFLGSFSLLMRKMLSASNSNFHSVQDEVLLIEDYLEIEKGRIGHDFDFKILIYDDIDAKTTLIPTMILQPLVENALWHGIMNKTTTGGEIQLVVKKRYATDPERHFNQSPEFNERLVISITDNGVGRKYSGANTTHEKGHSFGIKSITEKLDLLDRRYKKSSSIQIIDLEDENHNSLGTQIVLDFPIRFMPIV